MSLLIILYIREERQVSKSGVSGRSEVQHFVGTSPPGSFPSLYHEPAGGSQHPPEPQLQFRFSVFSYTTLTNSINFEEIQSSS